MKKGLKTPFLDTRLAIKHARRLEMAQNLLVVMHICSAVVLSYLDAGFESQCPQKEFMCVYLLLACLPPLKYVAHPGP